MRQKGSTYEKAGVNVSSLRIPLNVGIYNTMKAKNDFRAVTTENVGEYEMYACGLSLVIHPLNPHVPTTHCNYRLLLMIHKETQRIDDWWFGGGADLTPIYVNKPDAIWFHQTLKNACDRHDPAYYPKFKQVADDYFNITYRNERRGVGGTFIENLNTGDWRELYEFIKSQGEAFVPAYVPIVKRRRHLPYTDEEVEF